MYVFTDWKETAMQLALDTMGLSYAELLSCLSHALDLTSAQVSGHCQRTCLIGMRIGAEAGLCEEEMGSLYLALLMKDVGCSSNAARMAQIFGTDEISMKRMSKITDWSNLLEAAGYVAANTLPNGSLLARAQRILHIATHQKETSDALMHARCERGAVIAQKLGLNDASIECIQGLDEHWNGRGGPLHLQKEAISMLARIASISQTIDAFASTFDVSAAYEVIRRRSGKWFDPQLVKIAAVFENDTDFWRNVFENTADALLHMPVEAVLVRANEMRVDAVCQAFADVVDAKSSFTAEHSTRVHHYAVETAKALGFTGERLTRLSRAALLHDLGKLGVPNSILDKNGKPSDEEWNTIRQHPRHTSEILARIPGFEPIRAIAAAHHERLDGRGYYMGLGAEQLTLDMRILSCADVFDALSAKRPYRDALPLKEVFAIMDKDAGNALDPVCIDAFRQCYSGEYAPSLHEIQPAERALPLAA